MARYDLTNKKETFEITSDDTLVIDLDLDDHTSPIICCDCGLVHLYLFQLRGKKLYLRCIRSDVLTDQYRRKAARHAHTQHFQRTIDAEWERLGLDAPPDPREGDDG